jgi:N-acetylglucosamine-6-phosphate deacetylase
MTIVSGRLPRTGGATGSGWVETRGREIVATGAGPPPRAPDVAHDGLIATGLCDLQVNGAGGVEALDGGAALDTIDALLAARGITRWLAALPTAEDARVAAAVAAIAERAPDPDHGLAGAHLEGPFLSPAHPGVHRPELLRCPHHGIPAYYGDPWVRLVTLAPELPGALGLIGDLRARGVAVALGHSGADARVAGRALDAGARLVTHLFNAMAPLSHRAPGLAGVALTDRRALPCVIADGHHVDPIVLRIVHAVAADRVVLVSDASAPAATTGGDHRLGGLPVRIDAEGAVRTPDGALAGSGILLDEAVRRWTAATGAARADAVAAASWRPARAIGLRSGLTPGCPADLALLSDGGAADRVMRAGRWLKPGAAGMSAGIHG